MSYGRLLNQAPPTLRKLYRDKEHLNQKIINRKWSAIFNKKCLLENIVPNFSNNLNCDILFYLELLSLQIIINAIFS